MFHRKDEKIEEKGDATACAHMVKPLAHLADGTARGPLKWLAEQHVAQCPRCAAALRGMGGDGEASCAVETAPDPAPAPQGA
jgi:hypothetical protein